MWSILLERSLQRVKRRRCVIDVDIDEDLHEWFKQKSLQGVRSQRNRFS